jgi:probable rRNA maturation factor
MTGIEHGSVDSSRLSGTPQPLLVTDFFHEAGDWSAFEPIEDAVAAAVQALTRHVDVAHDARAVTIVFSNDAHVRDLNRQWRGQDKPTNVLSFPSQPQALPPDAPSDELPHLGDIILAVETIAREAAEEAKPPRSHLQHLVVHGMLHLLGYDHIEPDDADVMEALETRILAHLGVADPYAESEPSAAEA